MLWLLVHIFPCNMNDRRHAEIAFLAELVSAVVISCTALPTDKKEQLDIAEAEYHRASNPDKLRRRVARMMKATLMRLPEGMAGEKVVIITYRFFELLVQEGIIEVPEDSPAAQIMDWLLSAIDPDDPVTQKRIKNADKDARKWLERLQTDGYFPW